MDLKLNRRSDWEGQMPGPALGIAKLATRFGWAYLIRGLEAQTQRGKKILIIGRPEQVDHLQR